MAAAINDKSDGFLDDLLPHAKIELNETVIGCNQLPRPQVGLTRLRAWVPNLVAAIGPGCSGDLESVASQDVRQQLGHDTVFISPSSTADSLSDEAAFPNVARLSSPERYVGGALAAVAKEYGWQRVGLLHDDSVWGTSSADAFADAFLAQEGRQLLTTSRSDGPTGAMVSAASCNDPDEARAAATEWLERLHRVHARVIMVALNPPCQRALFQ